MGIRTQWEGKEASKIAWRNVKCGMWDSKALNTPSKGDYAARG